MEGNDLAVHIVAQQATMFEGVLAAAPAGVKSVRYKLAMRSGDWETAIGLMTPNDLPLKSLVDSLYRRNVLTTVYTLFPVEAVDHIDKWLVRKSISTPIEAYTDIESLATDLRYNRAIKVIYVSDPEHQAIIGMRATVVSPTTAWSL